MGIKCPDCGGYFEIFWIGGGFFHYQCKKCGKEFEAKKGKTSSKPLQLKGEWPFEGGPKE